MPFDLTTSPGRRKSAHTENVIRQYDRAIDRVLAYFGYTIHDVINDPRKKEHVKRAYAIVKQIGRDLVEEPWRCEATENLGARVAKRFDLPEF